MSDNKRNGSFAGKGYYIALILCAAAIGITSYVYYRNDMAAEEAAIQETYEETVMGTMAAEDVPALATQPKSQEGTFPQTTKPTQPAQSTPPAPVEKKPMKPVSPVSGEAIAGYSMEALSYNQTTRDWRVHNGIDYGVEAGTEVLAAADGRVYTVYEDDALGYTVVIQHDDGYTTKYSSLAETMVVNPGDSVIAGQTIGYAGDTAIVETAMGSHVHFSVSYYDEPMDPGEFLAMGQ